jgi:hypothetical protein
MNNPTGRPRLPPNVRLEASDGDSLNLTNEEYQELIVALSTSISHYQNMIDVSVPPSTTEDEQAVWAMKKRVGAWRDLLIKGRQATPEAKPRVRSTKKG